MGFCAAAPDESPALESLGSNAPKTTPAHNPQTTDKPLRKFSEKFISHLWFLNSVQANSNQQRNSDKLVSNQGYFARSLLIVVDGLRMMTRKEVDCLDLSVDKQRETKRG
jgi:hypothetical protein